MIKNDSKPSGSNVGATESNPLPEILNIIPWEYTVVAPKFLDDIRALVIKHDTGYNWYSNAYIMYLLLHLHRSDLVSLAEFPVKDSVYSVYLVKRV